MDDIRDYESRINAALERIAMGIESRPETSSTEPSEEVDRLKAEIQTLRAELDAATSGSENVLADQKIAELEAENAKQRAEVQALYDQLAAVLGQEETA